MCLRLDVVRDESEPACEQSLCFLCVMLGTFTCAGLRGSGSHFESPPSSVTFILAAPRSRRIGGDADSVRWKSRAVPRQTRRSSLDAELRAEAATTQDERNRWLRIAAQWWEVA